MMGEKNLSFSSTVQCSFDRCQIMFEKLLFLFLLCSTLYTSTYAKRSFNVILTNITCINNPDVAVVTCETAKYEGRTVVNIKSLLVKDVVSARGHVIVDIIRQKFKNVRLFDFYVDGCKFLQGASDESVVLMIYKIFRDFSTFPNKCPLLTGNSYSVTNFYIDSEKLPAYTPEAAFYFNIELRNEFAFLLNLSINGIVEPKDHIEEDCKEIQCPHLNTDCPWDSELKSGDEDNIFDKVPSELIPFELFSGLASETSTQTKHEVHKRSFDRFKYKNHKLHKLSKRESGNSHLEADIKRCCPEFQCVCKDCDGVPKCENGEMVVLQHQGYGLPGSCCPTYKCVPVIECSATSSPNVSYYKDECTKCDCYGGQELCQKFCEIKKDESASNCYSEYLSRPMLHGDSWLEDQDCTECSCDNGENRCQESICNPVDCTNPIKIAGQCCKVCLTSSTITNAPSNDEPTESSSTEITSVKSSPTTDTSVPTSTSNDIIENEDALSEKRQDNIETTFSTPAVISSLGLFEKYGNIIAASVLAVIIVALIGCLTFMLLQKQKKKKSMYSTIPCIESNQSSSVALA